MARPRSICFTVNNPDKDELERLWDSIESSCSYGIWQLELGGSTGTRHIQGYACCGKPTTFKRWKEIVGQRAHIEAARGTAQENKAYCSKEDTRVEGPWEHGCIPQPGQRSDLTGLIAAARDATIPMADVLEEDPEGFLRYYKGIYAVRALSVPPRNFKTEVRWYYGATGTGKSRQAYEEAPGAYWKPGGTKWWCGYDCHEYVIVDDYRRDLCTFSDLLRLCDRYPLVLETKGSSVQFVAKVIIFTTPKSPEETWEGRTEEDLKQLLRRIDIVKEFKEIN